MAPEIEVAFPEVVLAVAETGFYVGCTPRGKTQLDNGGVDFPAAAAFLNLLLSVDQHYPEASDIRS